MSDEDLAKQIAELEQRNERLKQKAAKQHERIEALKERAARVTKETETEEESIANGFFRKYDELRESKHHLQEQLQAEEASAKTIVQKICEVRRARIEMENALEGEQENQMHALQRKLLELAKDKAELESRLHEERSSYLEHLSARIGKLEEHSTGEDQVARPVVSTPPEATELEAAPSTLEPDRSIMTSDPRQPSAAVLSSSGTLNLSGLGPSASQVVVNGSQALDARALRPALSGDDLDGADSSSQTSTTVKSLRLELEQLLKLATEQHTSRNGEETIQRLTQKLSELQAEGDATQRKVARLRDQLEKAQTDLQFEKELQERLKSTEPSPFDVGSQDLTSIDQESVRTQSSDSSSSEHRRGSALRERDLRAHTYRLLKNAPNPSRGNPPSTPPQTARSASISSQGTNNKR
jgi:hypothetical protein